MFNLDSKHSKHKLYLNSVDLWTGREAQFILLRANMSVDEQ
jgi:hypothetical protein